MQDSETQPILGIDLDGCVDEAPLFFRTLTQAWQGKVIVITFRDESWTHGKQVLGLTTVNYDKTNGEIFGADMELNTYDMDPLKVRDPVGPIHWAGTETSTQWPSFIDGAIRSGERAAQAVRKRA